MLNHLAWLFYGMAGVAVFEGALIIRAILRDHPFKRKGE